MLTESIRASRKRPLLRIPQDQRGEPPWSLMAEWMRGEHNWFSAAGNPKDTVTVVDRNGSYPSAMGCVPVAANKLVRAGGIDYTPDHAGMYLIDRFKMTHPGPHPLGEIAERPGFWWVSTPHLKLAMKLATQERITPGIRILDSWVGTAATNLFKKFSEDVRDLRERAARNPEVYEGAKRQTSIAIRCLWPKGARSPFWRPDWSIAVRAEAAVRHWVKADQAVAAGATLVKLGSVDEAAFLGDTAPFPYKIGTAFGEIKIKNTLAMEEFHRGQR